MPNVAEIRLKRQLAQMCASITDARVHHLDNANPEKDWKRFSGAFADKLGAIGGPDFTAALNWLHDRPRAAGCGQRAR